MFHKEGHKIIIVSFLLSAIFTILIENFITTYNIKITLQTSVLLFFILILQFFRNPTRKTIIDPNKIIAPVTLTKIKPTGSMVLGITSFAKV